MWYELHNYVTRRSTWRGSTHRNTHTNKVLQLVSKLVVHSSINIAAPPEPTTLHYRLYCMNNVQYQTLEMILGGYVVLLKLSKACCCVWNWVDITRNFVLTNVCAFVNNISGHSTVRQTLKCSIGVLNWQLFIRRFVARGVVRRRLWDRCEVAALDSKGTSQLRVTVHLRSEGRQCGTGETRLNLSHSIINGFYLPADSDSELFFGHCLQNNTIAHILILLSGDSH